MYNKTISNSLLVVLILLIFLAVLIFNLSITAYATTIEDLVIEFSETTDGFFLSCSGITEENRSSIINKIETTLKNKNTIFDTSYYVDCLTNYIDISTVEDSFGISKLVTNVKNDSEAIESRASAKDVSVINTVTRKSSDDDNEYKAYRCKAFCEWSVAPFNRFKDVFAISIESDTTPLYKNLYGRMRSIFNVYGQSRYDSLGDERVVEHSVPGGRGIRFDLPANVILGGLIYIKMEFEVSVTVLTKSDFNMYSGYAHRTLVGSVSISTSGAGFSVNSGTDLYTGNAVSQKI